LKAILFLTYENAGYMKRFSLSHSRLFITFARAWQAEARPSLKAHRGKEQKNPDIFGVCRGFILIPSPAEGVTPI